MKFLLFFLLLTACISLSFSSSPDSLEISKLKENYKTLSDRTEEIRKGQLNYSIEKDLLKDTYSSNYERMNFFITAILAIVGFLTFLGLRDVNSIKKELSRELESIRSIKTDFEVKSQSFDIEKERFDSEIKKIITQNEEQNSKIKVLELKEKIKKLLDENLDTSAYEYCSIALELAPDDVTLLTYKAILQCRLANFNEAANTFEKVFEFDTTNPTRACNFVEALYFTNQIVKAKGIISAYPEHFNNKEDGKLLRFFSLIENYYTLDDGRFKDSIIEFLNFINIEEISKFFKNWGLLEAMHFIFAQEESTKKTICKNVIWYLDGKISTKTICERLNIEIPIIPSS